MVTESGLRQQDSTRLHSCESRMPLRYHSCESRMPSRYHSCESRMPSRYHSCESRNPSRYHSCESRNPSRYHSCESRNPSRYHSCESRNPSVSRMDSCFRGMEMARNGNGSEWKWLGMEMARNGNGREWARDLSQSSIFSSRSRSGSKFCVSRSRINDLTRVSQPVAVLVTS